MERIIDWTTNTSGIVQGHGLHDGKLRGIIFDDNDNLIIHARSCRGDARRVELSNVVESNVMYFWKGTIISDLWLFPINVSDLEKWNKLYQGRITTQNCMDDINQLISRNRNLYLFILDSSYGAEIYATCDGIRIYA